MGYSPNDWFGVYLDLQYVQVETNTVGSVDIQRVALGIETKPNHLISLRAGTTLDSENELTISAGLRVYVFEKIPIDIAYQYNNAPEVKKEFGTINSINASLAIPF